MTNVLFKVSTCKRNWKYCFCYVQKWQTNEAWSMRHMRKTKTHFIKRDATGESFLNTLVNKLPFEMHLPGHNFTGPWTKLYKIFNPDGTPKEWSIPINRVDNAAYHHDLCYSQHDDTKTRNEVLWQDTAWWVEWYCEPNFKGENW